MRKRVLLASVLVLAATSVEASEAPERVDPRSHELLRLDCSSRIAGSEVTFFANGTLRLRERSDGESEMFLGELNRREVEDLRTRLAAEGWPGDQGIRRGVAGEWVDQCVLTIELEPGVPFRLRYSRVDTLPLSISRLVTIADEILELARERGLGSGFPTGYRARIGDVVRRRDGAEFEVRRFTSDGKGVELEGLQQPVVLYLERDEVAAEFAALVRRRR